MRFFISKTTYAVVGMAFCVAACGGTTTGTGGQGLNGSSGGGGAPGGAEASGGSGANNPAPPATGGFVANGGATVNVNGGASQGMGGSPSVPPVYVDDPLVDASGLPLGTCRSGALYYSSGSFTESSIPIELQLSLADRPEWANTANLQDLSGPNPRQGPICQPWGLGLDADGVLHFPPGDGELRPILSGAPDPAPTIGCNDYVNCHSGGGVGVTWDCGAVPQGTGGFFSGVYALVGYVTYDQATYPKLGGVILQTLYIGYGRALLVSDDDNNFGFVGTYTYAVTDNVVTFTPNCESQPSQYRAFPAQATFTGTESGLELFDAARNVRSTYVRITPAE